MFKTFDYISRYFHTIKYLKFSQIFARLIKQIKYQKHIKKVSLDVNDISGLWQSPIRRKQTLVSSNEFTFLNETKNIVDKEDWNSSLISKLWLYHLHYFEDLNAIDNEQRRNWHIALIDRWIRENQPGNGNGWEAYPTSIRIVNWIKYFIENKEVKLQWKNSLIVQTQYLFNNIEKDILGNHLLANSKALIFSGLFFKGKESELWLVKGEKILNTEYKEQILKDGGHFELSPMYHSIVLEDFLDLYNIYSAFDYEKPLFLNEIISKMFFWLQKMIHPDNGISFFNDSELSLAPSYNDLEQYSKRNKLLVTKTNKPLLSTLKESGYSRFENNNCVAIIDHGSTGPSYLGGHSHADTLSFELSLYNNRVIVNSGTSIYGGMMPSYVSEPERLYQRGTAAHSTIRLNKEDSSEVWGAFRLARRAEIISFNTINNKDKVSIISAHNGYKRLKGNPIHQREWNFTYNRMTIKDHILGKNSVSIELIYPLHPNVIIMNTRLNKVYCSILGKDFTISFNASGNLLIKDSMYYPEIGLSVDNKKIVFESYSELPFEVTTIVEW
jgi:uncharacterized heparinase superfamily protein